jgi:hypothetical protein
MESRAKCKGAKRYAKEEFPQFENDYLLLIGGGEA